MFVTPARCCLLGATDEAPSADPAKKPDAMPLIGYVDIIKAAGEAHGIPVLDLYHNMPINPNTPDDCKKYTTDGLHFNDEGNKILAKTIAEFLMKL